MIITKTPVRISFLGGGTDYPDYFLKHGGATIATAINQYTVISLHPIARFSGYNVGIHYSQLEKVQNIDEIQHPSARECLRFMGVEGVEIHYVTNLPARTGTGSSSSATVGLLNALHAFKGEEVTTRQLAEEAVHVEQDLIKERVGSQDQYACALGGLSHFEFGQDGRVKATPISMNEDRLKDLHKRLMLFYTGRQRTAHEILDEQIKRTQTGENEENLKKLAILVDRGLKTLVSNEDLKEFGSLLHEGWVLKRGLSSKVSTSWIDEAYDRARSAGAVGGKLLGAGGGGFLLLYVEPEDQEKVRQALDELYHVEFEFEKAGSQVIFKQS